jgi:hypothetical protein
MTKQDLIEKLKDLPGLTKEERIYLIQLIIERKKLTDQFNMELQKFEDLIQKANKNFQTGQEQLNIALGRRSIMLKRAIKKLGNINENEIQLVFPNLTDIDVDDNKE